MFKPFDTADWDGMAGASRFANGDDPLVNYDLRVDGIEGMAVLDGNGLYISLLDPDGNVVAELHEDTDTITAMRFLAAGRDAWTTGQLLDIGIELVQP